MPNEIDLRQEFLDTIFGGMAEIAKGMTVLIRRMRRDPINFAKTPCSCTDPITREPDLDTLCPFCLGEGFYWDEEWAECYKLSVGSETSLARRQSHHPGGIIPQDTYRFYFPYDANIIEGDTIIEVHLDAEGNVSNPARRMIRWEPNSIEVKRLDRGRIEFYILSCTRSNAIYIDKELEGYIENP